MNPMNRRDALISAIGMPLTLYPQSADWKPLAFDAHQNATVVTLTDLIIPATDTPGAKAVNANRYIDLFLADGPDAQRTAFLEGLAWLDQHARTKHGAPFVKLTEAQQVAILTELDGGGAGLEPGTRFFRQAKAQTARVYYNTKIGYDELNKGGRVPATFACATK